MALIFGNTKTLDKRIDELFKIYKELNNLDSLFKRINGNFEQTKKLIDNQVDGFQKKFESQSKKIDSELLETKIEIENTIKTNSSKVSNLLNEQKQIYDKSHTQVLNDFNKLYLDYKLQIEKLTVSYQQQTDDRIVGFTKEQSNAWKNQINTLNQQITDIFNNYELNLTNLISKVLNAELNKIVIDEIVEKSSMRILDAFNKSLKELGQKESDSIIDSIKKLIQSNIQQTSLIEKNINNIKPITNEDYFHISYNRLKTCLLSGVAPMIVGPAGSGKSLACEQVSRELQLPFYVANRVQNSFELTGFVNAQGKYVPTQFYEAYTKGGLFLFDEVDASAPEALVTINNAIAQGYMSFPGHVKNLNMHENFKLIAAGNTYGKGATSLYTGRNILDAATLDRFMIIDWDYDLELEKRNVQNKSLLEFCWELRKAAKKLGFDNEIIVSTRSIISLEKIITTDNKTKSFDYKDLLRQKFFLSVEAERIKEIKKEMKSMKNDFFSKFAELVN